MTDPNPAAPPRGSASCDADVHPARRRDAGQNPATALRDEQARLQPERNKMLYTAIGVILLIIVVVLLLRVL